MSRCAALAVCLALPFVAIGCGGSDGPTMHSVSGAVTFDGEPIEKGRILFRATEGDQRAYSAEIVDGRYELMAEPGEMAVEIRASRIIPGEFDTSNPDEDPQPVGEMYIPDIYNSRTTLTATVQAGNNDIPFDLESQ